MSEHCHPEDVRRALAGILQSPAFSRRQRPRELLRFLAEACLDGREAEIKESTIALEFLGRNSDFDGKLDSAVRVLAGRVREGLDEYYAQDGAYDPLRIGLPRGSYIISCEWRPPHELPPRTGLEAASPPQTAGPAELALALPPQPKHVRVPRWTSYGAVTLAIASIALYLSLARRAESIPGVPSMQRVSVQPGTKAFPSFLPNGSLVYAGRGSGNFDIYVQTPGGVERNLTSDSPADDNEPAASPDGTRIAFRSERDGGGIFLMSTTGGPARKLCAAGNEPAWSPDGTQIVASTVGFVDAATTGAMRRSQLILIDVASGGQRPLTNPLTVRDATQPSWSPHGDRVAFWGADDQGVGVIYTIDAKAPNAAPVALTGSRPAGSRQRQWSYEPFWSASGNALYYVSLRSETRTLWRVSIDERTGVTSGEGQMVPLPTSTATFFALSRDGRHLAYVEDRSVYQLYSAPFDREAETLGELKVLTQTAESLVRPQVSPDGQWISMESLPPHANIYVARADGSRLRQLTTEGTDRASRWVGGSEQISFISGHGSTERVLMVARDGGETKTVTPEVPRLGGSVWSPDFSRLWFRTGFREGYLMQMGKTAVPFPDPSDVSLEFTFEDWSPDGSSIIGTGWRDGDRSQGGLIALFDLRTHKLRYYGLRGMFPCWLSDSRRVIFHESRRLLLLDTQTGLVKPLLSLENGGLFGLALSPGDDRIYLALKVDQSDVWMSDHTEETRRQ